MLKTHPTLPAPKVLFSPEEIAARTQILGGHITREFQGEEVVIVCVLTGAFIFCSDLMRSINLPLQVEFVSLSSYGKGTESSGEVVCLRDCKLDVRNRNVIIVEDIIDSGLTIRHLIKMLESRSPKVVKVASLLFKPSRNRYPVAIDYLGFEIANHFVVGYGLDCALRYRELPYIGVLNASD